VRERSVGLSLVEHQAREAGLVAGHRRVQSHRLLQFPTGSLPIARLPVGLTERLVVRRLVGRQPDRLAELVDRAVHHVGAGVSEPEIIAVAPWRR
jgi:hypothetical protein